MAKDVARYSRSNWPNRESRSSWRDFLLRLKERGLFGVEFVVSDDHEGLRQAIGEVLPGAAWQRCCYVHFLRNALDHLARKFADDCLQELRWIGACPRAGHRPDPGDRRELVEVRRDLAALLADWQGKHFKLCDWVAYARAPLARGCRRSSISTWMRSVRSSRRAGSGAIA
jgi:putative transposase